LAREEIRDISQVVTCPGLKHAKNVFDAIRQLMTPPETERRKIGFGNVEEEPGTYLPLADSA
jgi:hypothetical protein